jgi:hypothetical protein
MQLQFVPVEEFYFALTLDTRLLQSWNDGVLVKQLAEQLKNRYGQASTVAAAPQNTYNYVFRVVEGAPVGTVVEVFNWGEQLRLSSNFGLERTASGKVEKRDSYDQRDQFAAQVCAYFAEQLAVVLVA